MGSITLLKGIFLILIETRQRLYLLSQDKRFVPQKLHIHRDFISKLLEFYLILVIQVNFLIQFNTFSCLAKTLCLYVQKQVSFKPLQGLE